MYAYLMHIISTGSFDDADLNNPSLEDLAPDEKHTLDEWAKSYEKKYPNVGWVVDEAATKVY